MNSPNAELMKRYNTEAVFLEKNAGSLPLAARLAAGIVGLGSARAYQREQQQQALQARAMNDQFRLLLAMRMDPVVMGMEHTRVPVLLPPGNNMPLGLTEGMVRLASAAGADMAQMEKDAGLGTPITAGVKGLGALISGFGKGFGKAAPTLGGALRSGTQQGVQDAKRTYSAVTARATPRVQRAPRPAPVSTRAPAGQVATQTTTTQTSASKSAPQTKAPVPETPPQPAPAAGPPAPVTTPPAATPSQGQAPGMVERMGMGNGAWKWKAPAIGAMALGSYGAYRAGKGALNALGRESPPSVYNAGGANSASGINQYGVPDRATSFS